MKRVLYILSFCLALAFTASAYAVAANFDLSGLSYDELVDLRKQVTLAIMQSDEWKQVTVPMGEYIVGEDIPAGTYTVTTGENYCSLEIYSNKEKIHDYDSLDPETIGKLVLQDGQTVLVEYDAVVFSPYIGLGF